MTTANVVSMSGMTLDVLGAVVLARSFILKHPTDVFQDLRSMGVWDFHVTPGARDLLLSWLIQSIEARVGAVLLGMGFVLQAVSQLMAPTPAIYGSVILLSVVGGAVAAFFLLEWWFVRWAARHALAFYKQLGGEATSDEWRGEISAREAELRQIRSAPRAWLKRPSTALPVDTTLTSNPSGPEQ